MSDPTDDPSAAILMGFKIIPKLYQSVRAIFAELGQSDTILKRALKEGQDITIDPVLNNPTLFFVVSEQQMDGFKRAGYEPTMLQLLGSSEVIALSEEEAERKFRSLKSL